MMNKTNLRSLACAAQSNFFTSSICFRKRTIIFTKDSCIKIMININIFIILSFRISIPIILKYQSLYLCLSGSVSLSVRQYPINVKTAEAIGPNYVGPHMTPRPGYGCTKLQKIVSKSFRFSLNFEKAKKNY